MWMRRVVGSSRDNEKPFGASTNSKPKNEGRNKGTGMKWTVVLHHVGFNA
jgi:hypothetical protein